MDKRIIAKFIGEILIILILSGLTIYAMIEFVDFLIDSLKSYTF